MCSSSFKFSKILEFNEYEFIHILRERRNLDAFECYKSIRDFENT